MLGLFGMPGPWELLIFLGIALLLFGGKRIPELMRSLGQSVVEFKKGVKGIEEEPRPDEKPSGTPKPSE